MKLFQNVHIRKYKSRDRVLIEEFRKQSVQEGNKSLSITKYDPDRIQGQTWMVFIEGSLASISVCEASHYTGDPEIAARVCRYHILKKYRYCNAGFRMLPHQVNWAIQKGFKVIYWTHDIQNKPLNALYNHQRIMPGKNNYFQDEIYKSFKRRKDILFKVDPISDFLQYIYVKKLQADYNWMPKKNVVSVNLTKST